MGAKPGSKTGRGNTVYYKDVCVYRRDILEKVNFQNVDYAQQYLKNIVLNDISAQAKSQKIFTLTSWFDYIYENQKDKCIIDISSDELEEYFYFLASTKGNKAATISHIMSDISSLYVYLRKKKIVFYNPMDEIKRPNIIVNESKQHFLTEDQVNLLKQKLRENGDLQLETYVFFSLSTGARAAAVSRTMWEQIDFDNRTVNNVKEKNHKTVQLYFNKHVKELLLQLKQSREKDNIKDGGYVFIPYTYNYATDGIKQPITTSTLGKWAHKAGALIDVPELHPHDFRYTAAMTMLERGGDIGMVSLMLHHNNIATTFKHYIRKNSNDFLREYKDKFDF